MRRLMIMDGMRLVWHGGPLTQVQDFIEQTGILMVATDPVAMDTVEPEAIEKKRRQHGAPSVWEHESSSITPDIDVFFHDATKNLFFPAANVAVIVDRLEPSDEVANLLSRHNIPFQVFIAADLKTEELKGFDIVIVFAKPDAETVERIKNLAEGGATVVVVDAHGKYSWQSSQPVQLNEHTTSYSIGNGKVLELA